MIARTWLVLGALASPAMLSSQVDSARYGDHPTAGAFLRIDDAQIYYERYGSGPPVLLLHGGLFGTIGEFASLLPALSRDHTVIAMALRGHGRSEIGAAPLTNRRFAEDAAAIVRQLGAGPVDVVGFSTGAIVGYLLTIEHPELVRSLIAIGGPIAASGWTAAGLAETRSYNTPEALETQYPALVAARKRQYANPADWDRLVREFAALTNEPDIPADNIRTITQPTLIVAGDRDHYTTTEHFVEIFRLLPNGALALIPDCGHVVLNCKPALMGTLIQDFLRSRAP